MSPVLFASLIVAAIIAAGLAVIFLLLMVDRGSSRQRVQRRLLGVDQVNAEFDQRPTGLLLNLLSGPGRVIDGLLDDDGESATLLAQAGWRSNAARATYYMAQALTPMILLLATFLLWLLGSERFHGPVILVFAFGAVALGLLGPRWVLRSRAARRMELIRAEVPQFIHILVLLFEAGLSTRQALASLVREGRGVLPVLGAEFELVMRQLDAGGDTGDVLRNMGKHLDISELSSVLGVIRQVERYGGEIREPLMESLHVLEERRSLELREKVNLLSGRMTVVMVGFFFPALLIFVAGPAFVSIIKALGEVN